MFDKTLSTKFQRNKKGEWARGTNSKGERFETPTRELQVALDYCKKHDLKPLYEPKGSEGAVECPDCKTRMAVSTLAKHYRKKACVVYRARLNPPYKTFSFVRSHGFALDEGPAQGRVKPESFLSDSSSDEEILYHKPWCDLNRSCAGLLFKLDDGTEGLLVDHDRAYTFPEGKPMPNNFWHKTEIHYYDILGAEGQKLYVDSAERVREIYATYMEVKKTEQENKKKKRQQYIKVKRTSVEEPKKKKRKRELPVRVRKKKRVEQIFVGSDYSSSGDEEEVVMQRLPEEVIMQRLPVKL